MSKVTDEERREIAERLRSWKWRCAPPECLMHTAAFGDDCPEDGMDCGTCEHLAAKFLADLIDPGTPKSSEATPKRDGDARVDRGALLALARDLDANAALLRAEGAKLESRTAGLHLDAGADDLSEVARRIRGACGEVIA